MNKRSLILIVDDDIGNIEVLNAVLEDDYETCFATSGEEAIRIALDVLPDLILLDVLMPGIDGYEVCRRLKEDCLLADVPIIFVTGLGDQEAEVRGLLLGAIDYVTKPVSPAIVRARVRNHLDLKRMRDELAAVAVTDSLTGLSNRRQLEQSLKVETARLVQTAGSLSVIMLDIDFFKQFNDTYGHPAGDRCIVMIAAALKRAVRRAAGLTARYGGEEFTCVLPSTEYAAAMVVARNIHDHVHSLGIPHTGSAVDTYVTVSVGVATAACKAGMAPELWIQAADRQLYLAKAAGRNNVVGTVFGTAGEAIEDQIELDRSLSP
jgi:diguanylate cyclase (GGDEF)-like protein